MSIGELQNYLDLISRFISGRITASEFEGAYLELFKADESIRDERVFLILDRLFSDVDVYCHDPAIRGEGDLGDDELLLAAQSAYLQLLAI